MHLFLICKCVCVWQIWAAAGTSASQFSPDQSASPRVKTLFKPPNKQKLIPNNIECRKIKWQHHKHFRLILTFMFSVFSATLKEIPETDRFRCVRRKLISADFKSSVAFQTLSCGAGWLRPPQCEIQTFTVAKWLLCFLNVQSSFASAEPCDVVGWGVFVLTHRAAGASVVTDFELTVLHGVVSADHSRRRGVYLKQIFVFAVVIYSRLWTHISVFSFVCAFFF